LRSKYRNDVTNANYLFQVFPPCNEFETIQNIASPHIKSYGIVRQAAVSCHKRITIVDSVYIERNRELLFIRADQGRVVCGVCS
jgi:hypothetical protein